MDHPNCLHANFTFADISMYLNDTGKGIPIIPLVQFLLCVNCHQAVPNPHAIERFHKLTQDELAGIKKGFTEKGYGVELIPEKMSHIL